MKVIARVALGIWIVTLGYWVYMGVTTKAIENDSRTYHIPIAQSVLSGKVWTGQGYTSPFSFYPGASEVLLAGMMAAKLPVNLFNVAGWVALFAVMYKLARRAGLTFDEAVVAAVGIDMLPTVMRLPLTQLVDIWMAVWWGLWIYLAEKPENKWGYAVKLGVVTGMVVGTKILGPILLLIALWWYGRKLAEGMGSKKIWAALLSAGIIGGWWYVRNWLVRGNPVYPLDFLWWKGDAASQLPIVWKFLVRDKGALGMFLQALGSEFLGWVGLLAAGVWVRNKWIWLGLANALVFFILPGSPGTIVSNCRYLIPAMMALVIGVWLGMKRGEKEEWLGSLIVVNAAAVLPQLDFKPKLILAAMAGWGIWLYKNSKRK